ncbi:protein FAR1-RELATED SEQUENCE 5-like [Silene latifolia]|uniref:protein FAR1-RELATED SEQUENCE 5-like n=1 Tax=Silene latifolia TaxID=37657 RepID=UPI003D76B9D9
MTDMQIVKVVNDSSSGERTQSDKENEFCRQVENKFTPYVGQEFIEIEEAVTFYKIYALACGFDVRRYTTKRWRDGAIRSKLVVCNREGFTHGLKEGLEEHSKEKQRLKLGATRTYNMCKEHLNCFENIGATLTDFKNFHRDIKCFIHERDGQLFIDRFKEMAEIRARFYFDYDLDVDGSLRRVIWADGEARRNYAMFGDAVSYDPTYSTNKYDMIFTPFTGVDHHKRSATFCGALIAHEDHESFEWGFKHFLIAMAGKETEYIITDQDAGIIKVVPIVFKITRHRFCMWHIMNKVPSMFGVTREDYKDFIKKLNDIIWDDDLEATEFDIGWSSLMETHGLVNDDWFTETFSKRSQWVMAYCRDLNMGAVMRTTQRSESTNSYFKRFEQKSGTIVEFWMRFESAMDQQRHTQKKLDNDNRHSSPKIATHLPLERHGAEVYTHATFKEIQEEVKYSLDTCKTEGYTEKDGLEVTIVKDACKRRSYQVQYNPGNNKVATIPQDYVAKRWTSDALRFNMLDYSGKLIDDIDIIDAKQIEMTKLWSEIHETVGLLRGLGKAEVESMCSLIREFREKLLPCKETFNKQQEMLGVTLDQLGVTEVKS